MNVDTSGITALVELHNNLIQIGIEVNHIFLQSYNRPLIYRTKLTIE